MMHLLLALQCALDPEARKPPDPKRLRSAQDMLRRLRNTLSVPTSRVENDAITTLVDLLQREIDTADSMPPPLQELWRRHRDDGGFKRGPPTTRSNVMQIGRTYGLDYGQMACLESAIRLPLEELGGQPVLGPADDYHLTSEARHRFNVPTLRDRWRAASQRLGKKKAAENP
jgi:hypothetical protein